VCSVGCGGLRGSAGEPRVCTVAWLAFPGLGCLGLGGATFRLQRKGFKRSNVVALNAHVASSKTYGVPGVVLELY